MTFLKECCTTKMSTNKYFPRFHSSSSRLVLIMGPMFSGKTSTLISEITRYVDVDIPVVYINSSEDTRGEFVSTHNSSFSQISTKIKTIKSDQLLSISDLVLEEYGVIAIDEGQFFPDLVPFVKQWMQRKKIIYVGGLDGDIHQKIFGDLVYLIPYASEVRKICAVCESCRKDGKIVNAPFTIRYNDSLEKKVIGGKDIYYPVCSDCLFATEKTNEAYEPLTRLNFII